LLSRYEDAYLIANWTVNIGSAIKAVGAILAALIVLGGIASTFFFAGMGGSSASWQAAGQTDQMVAVLAPILSAIVLAGLVGIVCYALGTVVAAQGQILRAALDSAVNTSPFLSNDSRATMMSL
jgi:hypothetical protein